MNELPTPSQTPPVDTKATKILEAGAQNTWYIPPSLRGREERIRRAIGGIIFASIVGTTITYNKFPSFENFIDSQCVKFVQGVKSKINNLDLSDAFMR